MMRLDDYLAGSGCVVFRFLIFYRASLFWPSQWDYNWLIDANWSVDNMLIGHNWMLGLTCDDVWCFYFEIKVYTFWRKGYVMMVCLINTVYW